MLKATRQPLSAVARPVFIGIVLRSGRGLNVSFGALLADKAFDADWLLSELDQRGTAAVIPPEANRKTQRDFDRHAYKWRHLIENFFAKIKEFRAIATRYERTACSYAANWHLVATIIALK
ncbi:transposase [Brucella sp. NBRC 12950]|uniref:transposase n=1 Tax=Brucella sp. NBRC 12950 TaxID=2994518 RepID=UPI0024A4E613|nr:transposase [Brucella sp. NBRC 12950]GLU27977.1 IS5 family transposase [Brucella sp. NBRC 12950]